MKSTFCVLPWNHLATHPHGAVSLCCVSDHTDARDMAWDGRTLLRLRDHPLEKIVNSQPFRRVRLQMLRGEEPEVCRGCYDEERAGVESKRMRERATYSLSEDDARARTGSDGHITPDLRYLELRLGNVCNLKCRTCNPASSSRWQADYAALERELHFLTVYDSATDFSWPESQAFWDQLAEASTQVSVIYLNGGEPMLLKRHWGYLRRLIELGRAGQVTLEYSTNLTDIPPEAFELWRAFDKVVVKASVDDLDARNRYLRYPTEWAQVERTLDQLRAADGVEVLLLQTVSAMNVYYLDEVQAWASTRGLGVAHNYVTDPAYLAPQALPARVRQRIAERLTPRLPALYRPAVMSRCDGADDPALWTRFVAFTQALDRLRGERFASTFPEVCALLRDEGYSDFV